MKPQGEPRPWREISARGSRASERAGALVRAVDEPRALTSQALSRIRETILANAPGRRGESARRFGPWRPGFVTAMLLFSTTTAAGTGFLWRIYAGRETPDLAPAAPAGTPATSPSGIEAPRRPAPRATLAPVPAGDEPALPPVPTESPREVPLHAWGSEPSSATASAPESVEAVPGPSAKKARAFAFSAPSGSTRPIPSASSSEEPRSLTRPEAPTTASSAAPMAAPSNETEAHVLAEALSELNRRRNPRGALAVLDRYDQLFPHGLLAPEARRLRLAALIEGGDHAAALALLDDEHGFAPSLGLDLRLIRAELRAEAFRCRDALDDFDRVVHNAVADGVLERGLYGRAICLGKLGQNDRARADLVSYRARFPYGRFSTEVVRLLGEPGR